MGPHFHGTVLLARPAEIWVLYLPREESAAARSDSTVNSRLPFTLSVADSSCTCSCQPPYFVMQDGRC
jgi:hypothetical protein